MTPSTRRLALVGAVLVVVVALGATACAKKATDFSADTTTSTTSGGSSGSTRDSTLSGGTKIAAADLTCHLDPDLLSSDAEAVEVPCTARHNQEAFELSGNELDDCYLALAASGIEVGKDTFDPTEYDITDERVSGHAFSSAGSGVDCEITLDTTTSGAVIGS